MTTAAPELPAALNAATKHQPAARLALAAALDSPSHAYLLAGPAGTGKRAAARGFAAELLAAGAPDPDSARSRALADPSPHPDLGWVAPPGAQHLIDEIRERVIEAAPYRPFEGERRVFVIEEAEALAEESQNALLKTLEEPAPFAHLILIAAQPAALLETVRSRLQPITFVALAPEALVERLSAAHPGTDALELRAAARLAGGDPGLADLLLSERGRELRTGAETLARALRTGELDDAPWRGLLEAAEERGVEVGDAARERMDVLADQARDLADKRAEARLRKEGAEAGKRAGRRGRWETLDAGLALLAAWLRDLAAVADRADDLLLTCDRAGELRGDANGLDPRRARRGAELVMDTRRRLQVNVSEELALEALSFRLEFLLRRG